MSRDMRCFLPQTLCVRFTEQNSHISHVVKEAFVAQRLEKQKHKVYQVIIRRGDILQT